MTENECMSQGTCIKPPLGVKPGRFVCEEHINDLIAAINRSIEHTKQCETEQQIRNRYLAIARYAGELKEFALFLDKLKHGGISNDDE